MPADCSRFSAWHPSPTPARSTGVAQISAPPGGRRSGQWLVPGTPSTPCSASPPSLPSPPRPGAVRTSAPEGLTALCGSRVTVIKV
ncbi:hypothetical protein ACR6C2_31645 [Streptomyces sp. INA 01156]